MKNIHILPTDQPSRLVKIKDTFFITSSVDIPGGTFYNIYITSDEEIKQGDWFFDTTDNTLWRNISNEGMSKTLFPECEKIILTTNPKLIPDGVQSIDDEFLEWFVKNSSCEFVEVNFSIKWHPSVFGGDELIMKYKIIIPQEESKKEGYICPHTKIQCDDECCVSAEDCHITSSLASGIIDCDEPKQSTLEEAAKEFYPPTTTDLICSPKLVRDAFIAGAKWQAERMYSEEDMSKSFFQGWVTRERFDDQIPDIIYPKGLDYEEKQEYAFNLWFENFKKK